MNSEIHVISSERLDLVTLVPEVLRLSLSRDEFSVERLLGLSVPSYWYEEEALIRFRLDQISEDPTYLPWSVRAISLPAERQMVGYINFHTKPGHPYLKPHAPSGVEFGFEVFPPYRRRGIAREASKALMSWANEQLRVTEFILSIGPDKLPSLRLAQSLGFEKVGSHIDEVDGPEDVFRLAYADSDAA